MTRWATSLVVMAMLLATASCAIQPDSSPRDVPTGERALFDPPPGAGASEGSSRIYVLTSDEDNGSRQLRSVSREVPNPTEEAVIDELIDGPNRQELEAGLRPALPAELTLLSPPRRIAGTLNVDLSPEILELGHSQLRLAVAAIVFTASELDGVSAVRLRVDGENHEWPDGRGELQSAPLTVYDYPGLVESTQPPYPAVPSETPA